MKARTRRGTWPPPTYTACTILHTSGSSIVGDEAMGEPSDRIFHEDTPIVPEPDKVARVAIDRLIQGAGGTVLCNTMIYGHALGAPAESVQVPRLARQAQKSGVARYIGRGLNRWSNTHIADVADLYAIALEKAPRGAFLYVESGEEELGNVARAIATRLGLGAAQPWSAEETTAEWGREMAVFALGSNSRVRADRRGAGLAAQAALDHAMDPGGDVSLAAKAQSRRVRQAPQKRLEKNQLGVPKPASASRRSTSASEPGGSAPCRILPSFASTSEGEAPCMRQRSPQAFSSSGWLA
jgi:hypothetical protein